MGLESQSFNRPPSEAPEAAKAAMAAELGVGEGATKEQFQSAFDGAGSDTQSELEGKFDALFPKEEKAGETSATETEATPEELIAAKDRVASLLGAGAGSSWNDLETTLEAAGSDIQADVDPKDAALLAKMSKKEREIQ
jgi:hypothetical protein